MGDTEFRYVVILNISLSIGDKAVSFELPLKPDDEVALRGVELKKLADCTLYDLRSHISALEDELFDKYANQSIEDLLALDLVHLSWVDEQGETIDLASGDLWPGLEIPVASSLAGVETEDLSENLSDSVEPGLDPALDVKAETETTTELQRLPEKVSVAETEQIHTSEVGEIPTAVPGETIGQLERPGVLIMGKRRPLGHPSPAAVDILINKNAFRDAQAHALSRTDREVAGFLIGSPPEKQPDGRYIAHVGQAVIARHTRMNGASVTYTPESWRSLHDLMGEHYLEDEAVVLGWYHTHPGFGIFLSGMDRFIHRNFFTQVWHIALVLDPLARKSGFFCWDRSASNIDHYDFPWPQWASDSW